MYYINLKMKLERSIPFLMSLIKSQKSSRMNILKSFPTFVIDDLLEIIINIVKGNVDVSEARKKVLRNHKRTLLQMVNARNIKFQRQAMYKQGGGFIAALLPIALAALGLTHFK